ncbi:hypothetical protein [Sphingobacterium humi]|jgi:hypothetical protein|uniref:hypothetical protein n=1 Tax=Sphingobacterium humi TaxID=1796905 RepID=UPI001BAF7580|nr:hypothetical protein [Sphingobacterium humi]
MPYEFKPPLAIKILLGLLVVILFFGTHIVLSIRGSKNKKSFYEQSFASLIIKSNIYQGRSVEFHLENGLKVYFLPPVGDKIMIGDSIRKDVNTYIYDVYRKDANGEYKFWATYNKDRIY